MPKPRRRASDPDVRPRADILRQGLLDRQHQLRTALQERIRTGRTRAKQEGTDDLERSERDVQSDLALSLLQIESENLVSIDAALVRLDAGKYGLCAECEQEISTKRLSAVPFAARCQACEKEREDTRADGRRTSDARGRLTRFVAAPGA